MSAEILADRSTDARVARALGLPGVVELPDHPWKALLQAPGKSVQPVPAYSTDPGCALGLVDALAEMGFPVVKLRHRPHSLGLREPLAIQPAGYLWEATLESQSPEGAPLFVEAVTLPLALCRLILAFVEQPEGKE